MNVYQQMLERIGEKNSYQYLAARTMSDDLPVIDIEQHALHGMVGEIGEIHSLFQKKYQGHKLDRKHVLKEIGDLIWFIAEYCTVNGVSLNEVMEMNIEKLYARYPDGFDAEHSLHRAEGDI